MSEQKLYSTEEVLKILKEGQKAFVTNHIGYKSHLVKVGEEFEWRYPPQNYVSEFYIDEFEEIKDLIWRIEE